MEDVTIVEKILRSLTKKYNYIMCSIVVSKDTDKMSVDELHSSLIVHEHNFSDSSRVMEKNMIWILQLKKEVMQALEPEVEGALEDEEEKIMTLWSVISVAS